MKQEERCIQLEAILSASEKARLVAGVRSIVQSDRFPALVCISYGKRE